MSQLSSHLIKTVGDPSNELNHLDPKSEWQNGLKKAKWRTFVERKGLVRFNERVRLE